ncbi:MAG: phage tail protein, partial [Proteobacteria bacterium]|nr:phage tail protein [Pseudomonadota bacterium]
MTLPEKENYPYPLHVFRFHVDFEEKLLHPNGEPRNVVLCSGAFAECSGLEATMEPKVIKEGGRNWGAIQRMGKITFSTVILKRGMTNTKDLWTWFNLVGQQGKYNIRLNATITMFDNDGKGILAWKLTHALPIKFKAADLNAKGGGDVAIEEIHLAHEGFAQKTGSL